MACDRTILDDNEDGSGRLNSLLLDLSGLLADKGSMVIALSICFISGEYVTRKNNAISEYVSF